MDRPEGFDGQENQAGSKLVALWEKLPFVEEMKVSKLLDFL
jgi:hypothetical protein